MIFMLMVSIALVTGVLVPLFWRCRMCHKRRSLVSRCFALDSELCNGCVDTLNREIREKRTRQP